MKLDPPMIWLPAWVADAIEHDLAAIVERMDYDKRLPERMAEKGWVTPDAAE